MEIAAVAVLLIMQEREQDVVSRNISYGNCYIYCM